MASHFLFLVEKRKQVLVSQEKPPQNNFVKHINIKENNV